MYIEEHAEFLKARNGNTTQTSGPAPQRAATLVDITSGEALPPGFQTRRAG